jgi:hypothetical protein
MTEIPVGVRTPMRLHAGEEFTASGLLTHVAGDPVASPTPNDQPLWASIRMRRIGWLDQKGRVWMTIPSTATFDGGSLTPLLIQEELD